MGLPRSRGACRIAPTRVTIFGMTTARTWFVAGATPLVLSLALCLPARSVTVPEPVTSGVHGRVMGWAQSKPDWFAVYVDKAGGDWCGLQGASWWIGLVDTTKQPERLVYSQKLGSAMCGNSLAWVRAGRFSDGLHPEVAFMLWQTPSLGATTYVYRIAGGRLQLLANVPGDSVTLGRGVITARFENSGRSPDGKSKDVYRFSDGRYRLVT